MKRNTDDFDGMKDFIISIITVVAWVLIGSIITIGYFTIETKGESIILSFISTIFTIISSLGIVATISVYFWQKKSDDKKQKIKNDIVKRILLNIIKQRTKTMSSIVEFSEDVNILKEQITITSLNAVKINESTANLIAYSDCNEVLLNPVIMYSNEEMKEAMSKRYTTSDEVVLITEEVNQVINEIDKFISIKIIDHLSRENFHFKIKYNRLSETKKGGRFDYITELNELHERVLALH
ncbi:TPA: hypothetical protein JD712_RS02405 [Proteus mirabilis]|nr:hypothetical protein [Proteus mirabilis]HCD1120616.1 hypothetical protein [Proteus mirabilis]